MVSGCRWTGASPRQSDGGPGENQGRAKDIYPRFARSILTEIEWDVQIGRYRQAVRGYLGVSRSAIEFRYGVSDYLDCVPATGTDFDVFNALTAGDHLSEAWRALPATLHRQSPRLVSFVSAS